ncbi:MAG: IS5 family transposase [Phormidesmis priestleyi]|uniref:IS5 family transposase n=1 Tax=Phormidesmis priestleyi TaxID=268141 RepID=A0A2W5A0X6_9CYAN|nr:MAG: IS5 family transposase [Phormidesmis priestleyi]
MSQYRIRNWSEYNKGLKQRGSLTFWISPDILANWEVKQKTGKPGATATYSNQAMVTMVSLKSVMSLPGRALCGFVESIFKLMKVELSVPDHTTLSRRLKRLEVELPVKPTGGKRHVVIDSTGIKVYGEGEWKTRQHGISKRRTWRKLHLAVDEATGEILSGVVTDNSCHDSEVLGELLDEIADPISQVDADGAYDTAACYDYIDERGAIAGIPPQRNAKIWFHGNRKTPRHPRDENLRKIRLVGRAKWKRLINYHRRSLAETTMFRFKTAFGGKVSSRKMNRQVNELKVQCLVLNRMIQVAKPDSYAC